MYGWEYIPNWFIIMVAVIVILFVTISYWLSSGSVEFKPTVSNNNIETKVFYYENPIKFMSKPVEIIDVRTNYIGQVKRQFNSVYEMLSSLFLPNYYVQFKGNDKLNSTIVRVQKIKGRQGMLKSIWEGELTSPNVNERFVIRGESKNPNNVIASFTFQNELIKVSKQFSENTYHFYKHKK